MIVGGNECRSASQAPLIASSHTYTIGAAVQQGAVLECTQKQPRQTSEVSNTVDEFLRPDIAYNRQEEDVIRLEWKSGVMSYDHSRFAYACIIFHLSLAYCDAE